MRCSAKFTAETLLAAMCWSPKKENRLRQIIWLRQRGDENAFDRRLDFSRWLGGEDFERRRRSEIKRATQVEFGGSFDIHVAMAVHDVNAFDLR
jgi:hypothetical protein